jgi:hypothetical protein
VEFFDGPWSWKADWHGASVRHSYRTGRHISESATCHFCSVVGEPAHERKRTSMG